MTKYTVIAWFGDGMRAVHVRAPDPFTAIVNAMRVHLDLGHAVAVVVGYSALVWDEASGAQPPRVPTSGR